MSQIQDFIAKDPSSRKQTNNEVENLKNDLLTQPIFIKPGPAPIQIKTSSVTNTSRELGTDEIPLSPLKSVETMSQINDFVLKNVSRKEKNASKETEVEDLKNDLSTQAICSNPQQTDPSVIENPIEADEIPGSPGRVESISQIQQFVSRSKTRSSSSPKKRESVAVESEINSKPKRTRAPSWKMKLANEDTSNEVTEKPAPRRGRPKKIIIDDDEIDDSSPEVILTKKTTRLMETKSSSRKSADNRRGKRKADVNTKESESRSGSSNASTSKYPKLEVTKSTIPATNDDMDLDIADMIKMRKRSAKIRPGSLHPSEMNQFRHQNVIFTFMKSVELQNKVKKLGGTIGTSPTDCTVLVAEEVKRSVKFLCVLGLGKPIVTPKWIHDSFEANSFLDPMKYVLKDRKKETQFQFQLDCSLRKAKESPLLKNYSVFVTPSVKPPPSEMKEIIESCGGRFLPKVPLKWPTNSIVISCVDDEIIYKKWKSRVKSFPIIEAEGLITGILRQNLKFHQHLL
ncbi:hypothetical protein LSTR_LSTR008901 [Laodelphax striatellus]|uniref:BRCT domain-containing protein n=1 Tax=Laodelphax striatellus TaxID=195883 RepID=A0A482WMB3_LAOST|nr:hypothetical protein LSTR_LSTR008901 [Laodelphax striatellus]